MHSSPAARPPPDATRPPVPLERAVFMREQDNRMYGINAYYTAKMFRCVNAHGTCASHAPADMGRFPATASCRS